MSRRDGARFSRKPRQTFSRRQILKIFGASAALPLGILALRQGAGALVPVQWNGETLGGQASLTLWHRDAGIAQRTIAAMRGELARLESVFSLYRADSEISRLNHTGKLAAPSRDLVAVLDEARRVGIASFGSFDPTVQPLWNAYAAYFAANAAATGWPESAALDSARALTGFAGVDVSARAIGLAKPGMAITLNGIAQGYITDRIADLLRNEGFEHAMVQLGETRALGPGPNGQPFTVSLLRPDSPGIVDRSVLLADAALSVSGGYGMRFGQSSAHHIFDPSTGLSANRLLDVAVISPRAMLADALSTAIYVAGEETGANILRAYPSAHAILTRSDGSRAAL